MHGSGGCCSLWEGCSIHRCALARHCNPVQFPNSSGGFNLGVRVEECLNSTGEISGAGGGGVGGIPSFGESEIAQAFQTDV